MYRLTLFIIFSFVALHVFAQQQNSNPYGLKIVSSFNEYQNKLEKDRSQALVNLNDLIPNIQLDIRYATANNFVGQAVYDTAAAFLRFPAAYALLQVQKELNAMGLGLKIYDAYRPYSVTVKFYEIAKDTVFVAAPWNGSRHNRGCAVDLSLIDLKTGKELLMPTEFDDFSEKAHINYPHLPKKTLKNRKLLKTLMHEHGFNVYENEWWHYDYKGWEDYSLMDIPLRELIGE